MYKTKLEVNLLVVEKRDLCSFICNILWIIYLGKVKCWIFLCTVIYNAFADKKDFSVFSRTQYIYKLEINIFFAFVGRFRFIWKWNIMLHTTSISNILKESFLFHVTIKRNGLMLKGELFLINKKPLAVDNCISHSVETVCVWRWQPVQGT